MRFARRACRSDWRRGWRRGGRTVTEAQLSKRPLDSYLVDAYLGPTCSVLFMLLSARLTNARLAYFPAILVFGLAAFWRAGRTRTRNTATGLLLWACGMLPMVVLYGESARHRHLQGDGELFIVTAGISVVAGIGVRMLCRRESRSLAASSLLAGSVAGLAMLIGLGPVWSERLDYPMFDRPMPQLTLDTMDGHPLDTSSWNGHVVVLQFWASWCGPCKLEMPVVESVARSFQTDGRVKFVLVDTGSAMADKPSDALAYLQAHHVTLTSTVWRGDRDSYDNVLEPLGDRDGGVPALVVIDQRGRARWLKVSFNSEKELRTRLNQVLQELLKPQPAP